MLVPGSTRDEVVAQMMLTGDYRGEVVCHRKDGSKILGEASSRVVRGPDGEVVHVVSTVRDISERKKSEEKLRESERNLAEVNHQKENILKSISDGFYALDKDLRFTYVNDAAEKIWGLSRADLIGQKIEDVFIDIIDFSLSKFCQVLEEQTPQSYEVYSKVIQRWGDMNVYPTQEGISVYFHDITERKKAEEELKEARTNELNLANVYNRSLIEASLDPLVTIGPDGEITDVNTSTEAVTGYSRNELIGTDFSDYFTEPEEARKGYQQVFKEGKVHDYSLEIKHKNGQLTPVLYNATTYKDESGEVIGVFAAARDVTKRKKAEEEINRLFKESDGYRARLQAIIDSLPVGLFIADENGKMTLINENAKEIWGGKVPFARNSDEFIEYKAWWADTEEYIETNDMHMARAIHGEILKEVIVDFVRFDGTYGTQLVSASPIKTSNGEIIGSVCIIQDISGIKETEEQLKDTILELEHSNNELQSFAYITSHDLQEPLRTIASFTQLLKRRYSGQLDADADEFMDYMVSAAKRMKDMIQALLEYSRVDSHNEQFKEFESEKVVSHVLLHLYSSHEECNAEITYDNLPVIFGDEHQIVRVFQNLVSNALKFRKKEILPEIHISAQRNDDEFVFSVRDNGIGMEKQYSKKIFEPFKRLHTMDTYEGTGIGLSIVKKIIEHHGGRIWFESEFGKGSVFYFTLPTY